MWTRQELKMRAKTAFQTNYGTAVAVAFLMGIITTVFGSGNTANSAQNLEGADSYGNAFLDGTARIANVPNAHMILGMLGALSVLVTFVIVLLKVFVEAVLEVGGYRFFILNQVEGERPKLDTMLDGFRSGHYGNIVLTMFIMNLKIVLWTLLFIIPGIIKAYEYLMVPYILADNPGMDRNEAFLISKQMMDGQKLDAFVLNLSFIGWHLLSIFTCGLLEIFYVAPYYQATMAEFYAYNKMKAYENGYIR